jgi:hypothetical protein
MQACGGDVRFDCISQNPSRSFVERSLSDQKFFFTLKILLKSRGGATGRVCSQMAAVNRGLRDSVCLGAIHKGPRNMEEEQSKVEAISKSCPLGKTMHLLWLLTYPSTGVYGDIRSHGQIILLIR